MQAGHDLVTATLTHSTLTLTDAPFTFARPNAITAQALGIPALAARNLARHLLVSVTRGKTIWASSFDAVVHTHVAVLAAELLPVVLADLRSPAFLTLTFAAVVWAEIIATAIAAPALAFAVLAEAAATALLTLAAPNFVVGAECRAIALSALLLAEVVDAEGGPVALAAQLLFLAMLADARKGFAFLALRLGCAMLADRRVRASPRIVHEGRSQHAIQLRRLNEYHHARRPENQQCAMPGDLNQLCAMPGDPPAGDIGGGGGTGGGTGGDTVAGAASAALPCTPCGVQGGIATVTSSPGMAPSLAMTGCKSNPERCCQAGDTQH